MQHLCNSVAFQLHSTASEKLHSLADITSQCLVSTLYITLEHRLFRRSLLWALNRFRQFPDSLEGLSGNDYDSRDLTSKEIFNPPFPTILSRLCIGGQKLLFQPHYFFQNAWPKVKIGFQPEEDVWPKAKKSSSCTFQPQILNSATLKIMQKFQKNKQLHSFQVQDVQLPSTYGAMFIKLDTLRILYS